MDPIEEDGSCMDHECCDMTPMNKCLVGLLCVGVFLVVVLCPLSFQGVEYYQMAFTKQKSTGRVDDSKVYLSGRYFIGPDYTFKTFRADAHFAQLDDISTFTTDNFEMSFSCSFQYFLRTEDLKELHENYNLFYGPVVKSTAIAAAKRQGSLLSIDQFLKHRAVVEQAMLDEIRVRLEGKCCRKKCSAATPCRKGCIPYEGCGEKDKGLFVEVKHLQLKGVKIHDSVTARYLKQVTVRAEKVKAQYEQDEKVVRKKTEQEKNHIINQATEISQNATAHSAVILAKARAQSLLLVEKARSSGLKLIFERLNITSEEHKTSFHYLRTLRDHNKAKLNVNYQTLMARD